MAVSFISLILAIFRVTVCIKNLKPSFYTLHKSEMYIVKGLFFTRAKHLDITFTVSILHFLVWCISQHREISPRHLVQTKQSQHSKCQQEKLPRTS